MVFKDKVKDKLPIERKNKEKKTEMTERRPYDLWTDIDQLFDQFRSNFDDLFWNPTRGNITTTYQDRTPLTDVVDHGNHYEMNIEMPGISKDNINIEVTSNTIEISAEEETKDNKNKNWLRKERTKKSFYRAMELPEEFKADDVEAEIKNGILSVMLTKVEPKPKDKPKKVKIK